MKMVPILFFAITIALASGLNAGLALARGKDQLDEPAKPRLFSEKEKRILLNAEKQLYSQLKADGGISDPRFPLIIYARRVAGTRLTGVEFLRRDPSGTGFDLVGRAASMEVRIDPTRQQILVEAHHVEVMQRDGAVGYVESRVSAFELPIDLNVFDANSSRLLKKKDLNLSAKDACFSQKNFRNKPN